MFPWKNRIIRVKRVSVGMVDEYYGIIKLIESAPSRKVFIFAVNMLISLCVHEPVKVKNYKTAKYFLEQIAIHTRYEEISKVIGDQKKKSLREILNEKYKRALDYIESASPEKKEFYARQFAELQESVRALPVINEMIDPGYKIIAYYTNWTYEQYQNIGFLELPELIRIFKERETINKIESMYSTRISTLMEDKDKVFSKSMTELHRQYKEISGDSEEEKRKTKMRGLIMDLTNLSMKLRSGKCQAATK